MPLPVKARRFQNLLVNGISLLVDDIVTVLNNGQVLTTSNLKAFDGRDRVGVLCS
jgi:hypothetical protein